MKERNHVLTLPKPRASSTFLITQELSNRNSEEKMTVEKEKGGNKRERERRW